MMFIKAKNLHGYVRIEESLLIVSIETQISSLSPTNFSCYCYTFQRSSFFLFLSFARSFIVLLLCLSSSFVSLKQGKTSTSCFILYNTVACLVNTGSQTWKTALIWKVLHVTNSCSVGITNNYLCTKLTITYLGIGYLVYLHSAYFIL